MQLGRNTPQQSSAYGGRIHLYDVYLRKCAHKAQNARSLPGRSNEPRSNRRHTTMQSYTLLCLRSVPTPPALMRSASIISSSITDTTQRRVRHVEGTSMGPSRPTLQNVQSPLTILKGAQPNSALRAKSLAQHHKQSHAIATLTYTPIRTLITATQLSYLLATNRQAL